MKIIDFVLLFLGLVVSQYDFFVVRSPFLHIYLKRSRKTLSIAYDSLENTALLLRYIAVCIDNIYYGRGNSWVSGIKWNFI